LQSLGLAAQHQPPLLLHCHFLMLLLPLLLLLMAL
jgi:hypothetical protein